MFDESSYISTFFAVHLDFYHNLSENESIKKGNLNLKNYLARSLDTNPDFVFSTTKARLSPSSTNFSSAAESLAANAVREEKEIEERSGKKSSNQFCSATAIVPASFLGLASQDNF